MGNQKFNLIGGVSTWTVLVSVQTQLKKARLPRQKGWCGAEIRQKTNLMQYTTPKHKHGGGSFAGSGNTHRLVQKYRRHAQTKNCFPTGLTFHYFGQLSYAPPGGGSEPCLNQWITHRCEPFRSSSWFPHTKHGLDRVPRGIAAPGTPTPRAAGPWVGPGAFMLPPRKEKWIFRAMNQLPGGG